jgi:hypothetical protein
MINAREHIHQCRFAAAVFPEQGQNLSLMQFEIHAVVCHDFASEPFGNAFHFDGVLYRFQGCASFPVGRLCVLSPDANEWKRFVKTSFAGSLPPGKGIGLLRKQPDIQIRF